MGRGLAAILPRSPEGGEGLREIPLELVRPNPRQPRRSFDEDALARLAESIRTRGVLQPIVVRTLPGGHYQLVAGERRLRAAREVGLDLIPALLRNADERDQLDIALAENMARVDLNPVEEARACAMLVEDLGLTKEELGRRVGRSRVAISNLIRLLDLPDEVARPDRSARAVRGPRAGHPAVQGPRAAEEPGPRRPRRRVVGARDRAAGTGGGARPSRHGSEVSRPEDPPSGPRAGPRGGGGRAVGSPRSRGPNAGAPHRLPGPDRLCRPRRRHRPGRADPGRDGPPGGLISPLQSPFAGD